MFFVAIEKKKKIKGEFGRGGITPLLWRGLAALDDPMGGGGQDQPT